MPYVNYERRGQIGYVTMNRPERLNAFGSAISQGLAEAFAKFNADEEAAVAVLSGKGKAFCAGVDVKEFAESGAPTMDPLTNLYPYGSEDLTKPVIAAIHGYCLGAGFNVVSMRADLRIAAESAIFGLPEVARGIQTLSTPFFQQVPRNIFLELALLGENISAQRAYELGIVNRVVPDDQLLPTATQWAERIASHSPLAVKLTRQSWLRSTWPDPTCLQLETHLWRLSATSGQVMEGMKAWVEKREPSWEKE